MLAYYLKFFVEPTTRREFYVVSTLGRTHWANSVIFRMSGNGWIVPDVRTAKWSLTPSGHEAYLKYLTEK